MICLYSFIEIEKTHAALPGPSLARVAAVPLQMDLNPPSL